MLAVKETLENMAVTVVVLVLLRVEGNSRNMAITKRRWRYLRWQWRVTKKVQVHVRGVGGQVVDECKRNVTMTCSVP